MSNNKILYVYVTHRAVFASVWRRVTEDMKRAQCDDYIFICGLDKTVLFPDQHTLFLNCSDTYESLPEKMLTAFHFLEASPEFSKYEYFIKLDADLVVTRLFQYEWLKSRNIDYAGVITYSTNRRYLMGRCSPSSYFNDHPYTGPADVHYCLGGWGYILSRRALTAMKYHDAKPDQPYEDLYVGFLMRNHGITPVNFPMRHHVYSVGMVR